jgi:hypothetical protein
MRRSLVGLLAVAALIALPAASTAAPNGPPAGATGIALSGAVELAWQPVGGADGYTVYRGTSPTAIATRLTSATGITGTSYTDSTAANGTTYYYAVRAVGGGVESGNSAVVQARPVPRACSNGNPVVLENCYPGNTGWNVSATASVDSGGIEGFATASSINKGQSVDLKVNSTNGTTFRVEIYRSGYYGGPGARLFSIVRGLAGVRQPNCIADSTTGLRDCSNWASSATLTTTSSWPSGIYLLKLVREDNGSDNHILLSVRDDARASDILYGVADTNYQAYNNYGGKSLYDFNSGGGTTVAGTPRAVKVSFDRPYEQPRSGLRDWYTRIEYAAVSWLEREGYDVAYTSNTDLERNGGRVLGHQVYFSPAHDEYYSAAMRTALTQARNSGVGLFFSGGNEVYWKIRFEASPVSGSQDRVQVTYKSTQSGPPDPSGIPTGTWRDPAGANQPENALTGVMYIGDKDNDYFPLRVSASEGSDRVWRYTGLDAQPPGTFTNVGSDLVGWEWDARVANGFEPAGVKTLASSPVDGNLLQDAGRVYAPGSATVHVVKYTAASGALVFSTGTNHWNRGLANNVNGVGEPNVIIQQATTNVLADIGALPSTPAANIVLDDPAGRPPAPTGVAATTLGSDSIRINWNAVSGATGYNVYRTLTPRQGGQPLGALANGTLVTSTNFTDVGLSSATTYYYVVTAVVAGTQSLASNEASATTSAGADEPTRINAGGGEYTTSTGATYRADSFFSGGSVYSVPGSTTIAGTSDPALYRDERYGAFQYAIPVANGSYDVRLHFAELYYGTAVPGGAGKRVFSVDVTDSAANPDVQNLDIYATVGARTALVQTLSNITVSDGALNIRGIVGAADDPEIAAIEVIPRSVTPPAPTVSGTVPTAGATGVAQSARPQATFSRSLDPSTVTSSSFTLRTSGGALVPATVAYDDASRTATLTPSSSLALSTTYTARLETTIESSEGVPLASAFTWTFTTSAAPPPAPTVTSVTPAQGATGVARGTTVEAAFSRDMDPATITGGTFTLTGPGGSAVAASVAYDAGTRTARLTPTSVLAWSTTYSALLSTGTRAADGTPLSAAVTWSFTTAAQPPAPTVTSVTPASGATFVPRNSTLRATFSRSMDPSTLNASSFTLTGPGGSSVSASLSYDDSSKTATLTPQQPLAAGATFTAGLTTTVQAADGAALASAVTWTFSTAACPCSLFPDSAQPSIQSRNVRDGRPAPGPWSYELGLKLRVDQPMLLSGIRFYKSLGETGTHVGRLWSSSGSLLGQVTFSSETASGWQVQGFGTPIALQADTTYVVSVNANAYYGVTPSGLATQIESGPLSSVADGQNGVYAGSAGIFPTQSYQSSNYFVDVEVISSGDPVPPAVTATTPASGATDVARSTSVTATFSRRLNPSTVTTQSFTLTGPGGSAIAAAVSYNDSTRTVTLTPSSLLAYGTTYTATLTSAIKATDGVALSGPVSWSFTTAALQPPPTVTSSLPADGASSVARNTAVRATFSRAMDPATLTASSFTLTGPGGASVTGTVSYDGPSRTATLTPQQNLAAGATYTAQLTTAVQAADGTALASAVTWAFTTAACPCSLFSPVQQPAQQSLPVRDGRPAPGPWSYELGVKVRVDQPMRLTGIKFYKNPGETGTHVGRVWSSSGALLGQVTFSSETASGWQIQGLTSPMLLQAGAVYVVSVNANAFFGLTRSGLATQIVSGPLSSVADAQNGVYGLSAGSFPTLSWSSSNYFVDVEVVPEG